MNNVGICHLIFSSPFACLMRLLLLSQKASESDLAQLLDILCGLKISFHIQMNRF